MDARIRFQIEHIRKEMVAAVSSGFDSMKEDVLSEIRTQASEAGYREAIKKAVKEELDLALREEARRAVKQAMEKHRVALESAVFEKLTELLARDGIEKTLEE